MSFENTIDPGTMQGLEVQPPCSLKAVYKFTGRILYLQLCIHGFSQPRIMYTGACI